MVCATLANINRDQKKRRKPFTVDDFLAPADSKPRRRSKQSAQDMLRHVQAVQSQVTRAKTELAATRKGKVTK